MKQDYLEAALKKAQQTGRTGPEIDPYTGAPRKRSKTKPDVVQWMVDYAKAKVHLDCLALSENRIYDPDGKLKARVEESRKPEEPYQSSRAPIMSPTYRQDIERAIDEASEELAPDPNPLSFEERLEQLARAEDEHLKLFAYRYSVPYQGDGESYAAYRQRIARGMKEWCDRHVPSRRPIAAVGEIVTPHGKLSEMSLADLDTVGAEFALVRCGQESRKQFEARIRQAFVAGLPSDPPPAPEDPEQDPVPERFPKAPETFEPSLQPGDILEGKPLRLDPLAVELALPRPVEPPKPRYTTTVTGRIKRNNEIVLGSMSLPGDRSVALIQRFVQPGDSFEKVVRFGDGQEALEGTGVFEHYAPQIERYTEGRLLRHLDGEPVESDERFDGALRFLESIERNLFGKPQEHVGRGSHTPKDATHVLWWIDLEGDADEMAEISRFVGDLAPEFIGPNGRLVDGFALHLVNRRLWADTIGKDAIKGRQIGDSRHARQFRNRWGQHFQALKGDS